MQIKEWFRENKEGLIWGFVLGNVLFWLWIKTNNPNILVDVAKNTSGLFDVLRGMPFFAQLSITQFLFIRVWLGFVAVGMLIGAIADMMLPERIL